MTDQPNLGDGEKPKLEMGRLNEDEIGRLRSLPTDYHPQYFNDGPCSTHESEVITNCSGDYSNCNSNLTPRTCTKFSSTD